MSRNEHVDAGASDTPGRLPDDAVSDLLASDRRRHVIGALEETDGSIAVSDLARRVAALEGEAEPSAVDDEAVERIRAAIYQEHLPKLTATEVVTYDSLVGTVELATDDERLVSAERTDP